MSDWRTNFCGSSANHALWTCAGEQSPINNSCNSSRMATRARRRQHSGLGRSLPTLGKCSYYREISKPVFNFWYVNFFHSLCLCLFFPFDSQQFLPSFLPRPSFQPATPLAIPPTSWASNLQFPSRLVHHLLRNSSQTSAFPEPPGSTLNHGNSFQPPWTSIRPLFILCFILFSLSQCFSPERSNLTY